MPLFFLHFHHYQNTDCLLMNTFMFCRSSVALAPGILNLKNLIGKNAQTPPKATTKLHFMYTVHASCIEWDHRRIKNTHTRLHSRCRPWRYLYCYITYFVMCKRCITSEWFLKKQWEYARSLFPFRYWQTVTLPVQFMSTYYKMAWN